MYCSKCGTKNDDDAVVCVQCKKPLKRPKKTVVVEPVIDKTSVENHNKEIIVAIVIGLIIMWSISPKIYGTINFDSPIHFIEPEYKGVIDKLMKSIKEGDMDLLIETMPECYLGEGVSYIWNTYLRGSKVGEGIAEDFKESVKGYKDLSYRILETENLKGKELEDIKESYNQYKTEVLDAKRVRVKIESGKRTEVGDIMIVKIDGEWYLDMVNMSQNKQKRKTY